SSKPTATMLVEPPAARTARSTSAAVPCSTGAPAAPAPPGPERAEGTTRSQRPWIRVRGMRAVEEERVQVTRYPQASSGEAPPSAGRSAPDGTSPPSASEGRGGGASQ